MRQLTEPVVRPMQQADVPLIVEWMLNDPLWQRYGLTASGIEADFHGAFARNDLLLAADAERPACGFAWCLPAGMFGAFPYLKRLGVDPACARRGLGGLLLARLEEILAAEGHRFLFLLVSDFNETAQRFYERHGYRQAGAIPRLVLPDVTELLYSKALGTLA